MIYFLYLYLFFWFIRLVELVLSHTYTWQLKEYRWDRYREFLRSRQGLWTLFHPWYWCGLALILFLLFGANYVYAVRFPFFYLLPLYIIVSGITTVVHVWQRKIRRPTGTGRSVGIIIASLCILAVPLYFGTLIDVSTFIPYTHIISLLATPMIVAFLVFLSSFPARYFKRRTIKKATEKIASFQNLTVIGITGSYGKSSTKEFLATILSTKYKVLKTPKNKNSDIGVAQTILNELTSEHQMFVVEMGAYTTGEIGGICDIVHPRIGILTAINEQHQSLFGSLDETKRAKYELIESLPKNGVAIFNVDNAHVRDLSEHTQKQKKTYAIERPADMRAEAIVVQQDKLSFSAVTADRKQHMRVNLLGAHNVSNLLAAITAASEVGMTLSEIALAAEQIKPIPNTMEPFVHESGALIVNDSYSANPEGVIAALEYLQKVPRKNKVLVMMPLIELGRSAAAAHERIGKAVGEICDIVILTKRDFYSTLSAGSTRGGLSTDRLIIAENASSILAALQPYLNNETVILLENRVPDAVVSALCKK